MRELLADPQLDKFADILISIGQVIFASIVVPFFFGLDNMKTEVVASGLVLIFGAWLFSLFVAKRIKK